MLRIDKRMKPPLTFSFVKEKVSKKKAMFRFAGFDVHHVHRSIALERKPSAAAKQQ